MKTCPDSFFPTWSCLLFLLVEWTRVGKFSVWKSVFMLMGCRIKAKSVNLSLFLLFHRSFFLSFFFVCFLLRAFAFLFLCSFVLYVYLKMYSLRKTLFSQKTFVLFFIDYHKLIYIFNKALLFLLSCKKIISK